MFFLNQAGTVLEMGFIYAVVALGVYITYKILDFPDLSVDGTFPLGGAVFAVLLTAGCPWPVAMLASFVSGCAAGFVTGVLHVKLKINGLLAGIITMTALLSVNYLIAGGPMVSFAKETTLLQNGFVNGFDRLGAAYIQVALTLVLLAACKVALDLFLKTKMGFLLRATGDALAAGKTVYYTGHCTGDWAFGQLRQRLGEARLRRIRSGSVLAL